MASGHPMYLSYLLRVWQVHGEADPLWRASLESPQTGERLAFTDLDALVAFLREQMRAADSEEPRIEARR